VGRGVAADVDDRADEGTSSDVAMFRKPSRGNRGTQTFDRNHKVFQSNIDRLGLDQEPVGALVNLGVSALDGIQRSFSAQGLNQT
jgi:hypothetical protein